MNWHYQNIRTLPATLLILCCLVISLFASGSVGKSNHVYRKNITCIGQERDALLKFKHHIQTDHCGLMSSWGNPNIPDCCTWKGVSCSKSGHVIELHLSGAPYYPKWRRCLASPIFSPSLGELKHLKVLDISSNYFYDKVIPSSIGSLVSLIHLDLSNAGFSGNIPHQLGNLTRLTSLDLSNNNGLSAKSLNWLSRLTSLRNINLRGTDLNKAKNWSQIISSLPLLESLKMGNCELSTPPPSSSFLQSAYLRVIILSGNYFSSYSNFRWLLNTNNNSSVKNRLKYLDLSGNRLKGVIPDAIRNLESLTYLDLSRNSLSSTIPDTIGNLEFLTHLDLSRNSLSSTIPDATGNLKFLTYLDLSKNSLSSIIPDAIANLQSLMHMDVSYNSLSGPIPFSLGPFGALKTLHYLSYLNLSYNRLEGSIPIAIGDSYSILQIDLSNNHLQGPIPSSLGGASSLKHLDVSNNHIEGAIPSSIANLEYLGYVDLSRNNLSGQIPCKLQIRKPPHLANFSNNNLLGSIPKYLSYLGPDSFQGNPSFHMKEVQNVCGEDDNLPNEEQVGGDDTDKIDPGLYVSIGLGFYTGVWAFCGTLTMKNSWRHAYFRFLDRIIDNIYVTVVAFLARFRRNSHV